MGKGRPKAKRSARHPRKVREIDPDSARSDPLTGLTPSGSGDVAGYRGSTVSSIVLRGLVDAAEQAGVDRAELLGRVSVDAAVLADPEARVPLSVQHAACELAVELSGDPALGLHWARRLTERTFAPVSHLIAHSPSLREGLEMLARYSRLLSDFTPYQVIVRDDNLILQWLPMVGVSPTMQRFSAEMGLGGFCQLFRSFDGAARPLRVCFEYPAPDYRAEYTRFFEGKECFDQPFTGIVFDGTLLDAPAPQRDDDVREALEELAEQRLHRITRSTPYASRVRDFLVQEAWPHRTDMKSVARAMDLSVRSLRRHLASEGKSYAEVLTEALGIVAKHFLRDPRRTIREIAYEMGFSDTSTFHRAFKRWTGTTPAAYREEQLEPQERE